MNRLAAIDDFHRMSLRATATGDEAMKYAFRLYIAGGSELGERAAQNLKEIVKEFLPDCAQYEIVDIIAHPDRARADRVIASPLLVVRSPTPVRKILGDLSDRKRVLQLLGIS